MAAVRSGVGRHHLYRLLTVDAVRRLLRVLWAPFGRRLEVGRAPDGRYWCCRNEDNLEPASVQAGPDTVTRKLVCSECGRRHFRSTAKPKRFSVSGGDL